MILIKSSKEFWVSPKICCSLLNETDSLIEVFANIDNVDVSIWRGGRGIISCVWDKSMF